MGTAASNACPHLPPLYFLVFMYITIFEQKNKCNMADFQGKYNGDQIEQLLDKANDIDLTKYALKTDNAPTATKLRAARTIALSGAVTGSVSSDFGGNVTISTTLANFDASKIASGTISIDRLPKAALERLVVVADDTARFALTTATAQSGDTVKVTSTGKMYLIKDESKLSSEDGYEPYTASQASSVPWSGVTGKPSTFTPPTSSATVLGGIKVGYTTSGKNYKVQLDSSGNAYVNVPWTDNNTTYSQATSDNLGLVKIGYSANGKNYPVALDGNGKMYVNVPWTDTNTTYAVANESTNGLMAAADKKTMNRLIGVNTVTTLANLPISKRSITATLSSATTLSVQSGMQIGEELMIRCVPSAAFTQVIPNSGAYVSMSGTSITTTANKPFEINIWCYASGKYSIAVKEQD